MNFQNYNDVFNRDNYPQFRSASNQDGFLTKGYCIIPEEYAPCLCFNGKKFKFCCKENFKQTFKNVLSRTERIDKNTIYPINDKKLLSRGVENKSIAKKNISYCFAKDTFNNCSDKNVHSHTMSKGNVLKNLSNGYKVIKFDDHTMIDNISIETIDKLIIEATISEASTTVSFCKDHDALLFEDIEKDGNTTYKGSYIENLEYALKAATFDLYYNIMKIKYMSELFKQKIGCANNDFFEGYNKDIEALFTIYPFAIKLINNIKDYKNTEIESLDFITVSIELPFSKVNYSLSEFIPIEDAICFLNVINAPKPYIIISCYGKENIEKLKKLKADIIDSCKNNFWEILSLTLSQTQNIYFNQEQFNKLSNRAKFYLYLIHRFGMDFWNDDTFEYANSNILFGKNIKEIGSNIEAITQEIKTILYT